MIFKTGDPFALGGVPAVEAGGGSGFVGAPLMLNGAPHMTSGRKMTVGHIFSTILSSRKVSQFNVLKADVLARRFYGAQIVDVDDGDYSSLVEVIDQNDQFVPFVLAYAKRALIEAREGVEKVEHRK